MTLTRQEIERHKAAAEAYLKAKALGSLIDSNVLLTLCDMALAGLEAQDRIARLESIRGALREAFRWNAKHNFILSRAMTDTITMTRAELDAMLSAARAAAMEEPRKIDQTAFGERGNCYSACIAMMLGLDLADVPHWANQFPADEKADSTKMLRAANDWMARRGLQIVTVVTGGLLPWMWPKGYYIAAGYGARGFNHAVIYKDGELWHDPHPSRGGIEKVDEIDFILPLLGRPALIAVEGR